MATDSTRSLPRWPIAAVLAIGLGTSVAAVRTEADERGVALPVTALVDQFYADVQRMGGKRWDTSSLLARLEKFSA